LREKFRTFDPERVYNTGHNSTVFLHCLNNFFKLAGAAGQTLAAVAGGISANSTGMESWCDNFLRIFLLEFYIYIIYFVIKHWSSKLGKHC